MKIVTNFIQFFSIFFLLYRIVSPDKDTADLFIESPGDGEEFVYSPVGVNATLHCAVNSTFLTWAIDDRLAFESLPQKLQLHSRGIYQSGPTPSTDDITVSSVIVYGDSENNNMRICCQSFVNELKENCTTVIIYDRPLPPTQASVQTAGGVNLLNISWTSTTMTGVNEIYIIVFNAHTIKTTHLHYIFYQEITTADPMGNCGFFLAYVKAVNGAGESDPSNNVSIPSLPDIGPVTASLTHQVWKHDGEIKVNISFEPARYCSEYPLLSYLLVLRSEESGMFVNISLHVNETETVLDPHDGLEDNQKYIYTVTAINSVAMITTDEKIIHTTDVQSVNTTVIGESTIDIQCWFIHGSNTRGCKVVLVNEYKDEVVIIERNDDNVISASGTFNLTYPVSCYSRVLAFDIEHNNTLSNLSIEGKLQPRLTLNTKLCSDTPSTVGVSGSSIQNIGPIVGGIVLAILLFAGIIATLVVFVIVAYHQQKLHHRNQETPQVVYEEPYDWAVSRIPQIEPVMEECPAYGVLTK